MTNRETPQQKQGTEPLFTRKRVISSLFISICVGLFIGYLAPFGMGQLSIWISIGYWVSTCIIGYFIYAPSMHFVDILLQDSINIRWHRVAVGTLLGSFLMGFTVPVCTWLFFNMPINYQVQFFQVFPKAVVIGGAISIITMMRDHIKQQQQELELKELEAKNSQLLPNNLENEKLAHLMEQVPLEKRGDLLCLEMADHYLKIYTDKGNHLLLMRFKDAMNLLANYPGMQTHRSWWVAKEAVTHVKKENRKISLVLTNDIEVPVSRTYQDSIKQAGFN
ncbi:LytTR family DNA-binding domain-containing protein [Thalassotalea crassostreae]|uniref:LytTR family DNA-binding domain-containing protein n=1 Tax=Thalassotalea crassostreae TaxID=1763536 RepID=UPI0008A2F71C|nr:LytTR family DNA-binding domain-containing protein [Thalassotalea crassostreae]